MRIVGPPEIILSQLTTQKQKSFESHLSSTLMRVKLVSSSSSSSSLSPSWPLHPPLLRPLLGLFFLLFFVPFLASSSSSSSYSSSSSSFSTSNLNTYLVSLLDVFLAPPLSPGHYYRASLLLPLFSHWLRLTPGWLWPSTATLRSHLNAHRAKMTDETAGPMCNDNSFLKYHQLYTQCENVRVSVCYHWLTSPPRPCL